MVETCAIKHCLRDTGQPTDIVRADRLYDTLTVVT